MSGRTAVGRLRLLPRVAFNAAPAQEYADSRRTRRMILASMSREFREKINHRRIEMNRKTKVSTLADSKNCRGSIHG
jgi:hypothetical protein